MWVSLSVIEIDNTNYAKSEVDNDFDLEQYTPRC